VKTTAKGRAHPALLYAILQLLHTTCCNI